MGSLPGSSLSEDPQKQTTLGRPGKGWGSAMGEASRGEPQRRTGHSEALKRQPTVTVLIAGKRGGEPVRTNLSREGISEMIPERTT